MNVETSLITCLQRQVDKIRNVCVLAHVDHGKTTLSDHLIASNGLIHPRLAGELRYMDSKEEEQARGITMKSSAISLLHVPGAFSRPQGPNSLTTEEKQNDGYLINLIDSPGHVDFCSEVSTAARLSDGAFVVVDAVEGVCIQTHAVLRQAWEEKVTMCLVLNKVDRLILELRLTPQEAYERLVAIIAHVNMIISSFRSEQFISEADSVLAYEDARAATDGVQQYHGDNEDDVTTEDDFSPKKGNVAFASAHDGWGFRLDYFAEVYAAKMGCKASALQRALWGDYAYQAKTKRIIKIKDDQRGKLKPLFVQMTLEPLWKAYSVCDLQPSGGDEGHAAVLTRMIENLGLTGKIPERSINQTDPRSALKAFLRGWLPLAEAVLGMAIQHLPSPKAAAPERVPRLLPQRTAALKGYTESSELKAALDAQEAAITNCDASPDAPCVVYISKMVAVPANALPRAPGEPSLGNALEERFLAFGRVFSGVLKAGQTVWILPNTYNPAADVEDCQQVTIQCAYLMMGRGLERLPEVPAGNVLAISGLDKAILKSATVADTALRRPLAPMLFQAAPIVRVAVEPADPSQMPQLAEGLRLLHKADPMVEIELQETGEHVVCAAGEVHLETCIKDLKERFARIELMVSPPLVAFKESIFRPEEAPVDSGNTVTVASPQTVVVEAVTPSGACTVRVKAIALPASVASAIDQAADDLKLKFTGQSSNTSETTTTTESSASSDLSQRLVAALENESDEKKLSSVLQRIWMLGPRRMGPNLLLTTEATTTASLFSLPDDKVVRVAKQQQGGGRPLHGVASAHTLANTTTNDDDNTSDQDEADHIEAQAAQAAADAVVSVSLRLGTVEASTKLGLADSSNSTLDATQQLTDKMEALELTTTSSTITPGYIQHSVESGVAAGFQLATANGPLCDEPLWGVAFEIEARINFQQQQSGDTGDDEDGGGAVVSLAEDVYGPFSGQITSAVRQALRKAVLESGPRLVEALFLCEISTSAEALSAVYAVLGRRRARILREELKEGSGLFSVHAYLPAEASFGFVEELRRRSSGAAAAALMLSHWERLQVDPFFVPTTEEEREEFGEEGQGVGAPNLAKKMIDAVRRRKGLAVEEKVVEVATKQRTRARKV